MSQRPSILSHEERAIARYLRENPDATAEEVAEARDADPAAVEKAIDRIREKTDRAATTLAESPFLDEAVADLDADDRERLLTALRDAD